MITNENVITDPHELLAYAIVDSMKEDYIKALERNDKDEIYICEEFFKSDYCKILLILTDVTGESIMKECRRVAKMETISYKKFREEYEKNSEDYEL